MRNSLFTTTSLTSALLVSLLSGAAPAHAQAAVNAPAPLPAPASSEATADVIIVTGSRIPRPSLDNAQPTAVIDKRLFENRAYTNVADALNQLPGFGLADSSTIGDQGNGLGVGQSFVNL